MLPYLKTATATVKKQLVTFRGINWSEQAQDGELAESRNLSTRRWPCLATRRGRTQQAGYTGCTALTARGELVAAQGTDLLYDGETVGTVTAGEKQFAVVNTKMVIWPDKVYLDLTDNTVKPLGATATGEGGKFTASTLTVTGWDDLTEKFKEGDTITVSGCTSVEGNNKDVLIKKVSSTVITVDDGVFTKATERGELTLERKIPDLDYICESENRLWGCSSADQTIYASALGDPTNFFNYSGLSTDSYALAVGTEGDFTGCVKQTSSILFWKETKLHKILGSYPGEYAMYTYEIEGLQKGCHKSQQVVNEVLYYMGLHGVYAYSGGVPDLISAAFGERTFSQAVGGTDGDSYYLSARDGNGTHHMMVYETQTGMWLEEDSTKVVDFARIGRDMYFLDGDGNVWLADSGSEDGELDWMARFTPFYETIEGRKRYSRLTLRVELPKGAWMRIETSADGSPWRESGKLLGRDADSIPVQIPVNRCDKFEVRLSGKGPCVVRAMALDYSVGSDT